MNILLQWNAEQSQASAMISHCPGTLSRIKHNQASHHVPGYSDILDHVHHGTDCCCVSLYQKICRFCFMTIHVCCTCVHKICDMCVHMYLRVYLYVCSGCQVLWHVVKLSYIVWLLDFSYGAQIPVTNVWCQVSTLHTCCGLSYPVMYNCNVSHLNLEGDYLCVNKQSCQFL